MKIKYLYFKEHPILGEIYFDFTDSNEKTLDSIIFAGENGSGKTVLLEGLFQLATNIFNYKEDLGKIYKIYVEFSEFESERIKSKPENLNPYFHSFLNEDSDYRDIIFKINYYDKKHPIKLFLIKRDGCQVLYSANEVHPDVISSLFKALYSNVEINFISKSITSVTSKSLDTFVSGGLKTPTNLATEITQLLVDIRAQDNEDLANWAKMNEGKTVCIENPEIRMSRFTKAFEYMFDQKKFKAIETKGEEKVVLFNEDTRESSINHLSSGEKQIVFRGSFLLRNIGSVKGQIIIIDEPEISMHPRWQMKILGFYKRLFTDDNGIQTSQIFVATHSPFIVHNSTRIDDKVIILEKKNGNISIQENSKFFTWGKEDVISQAFKIDTFYNNDSPIVFLEGETDEMYFKKAIEVFNINTKSFLFKWIGFKNEKGEDKNSGNKNLDRAHNFLIANNYIRKNIIILLYDCDSNKQTSRCENIIVHSLPFNPDNKEIKGGIENIFDVSIISDLKKEFYKQHNRENKDGGKTVTDYLNKMKFCEYICNKLDKTKQEIIFAKLKDEIINITNIE